MTPPLQAPHLPELLRALAVRLERAEMSMTIQSVLVVISLLVHTCPDDLVNCLHAIQLPGKLGGQGMLSWRAGTLTWKRPPLCMNAMGPFVLVRVPWMRSIFATHPIQLPRTFPRRADERDALTAVMRKWTQRQMEVQEPYCIKLTCTARGARRLLPRPLRHRGAARGRRLDTESGVMTRARRAQRAEAWSEVPLRSKLVQLLIDARIESLTQGL